MQVEITLEKEAETSSSKTVPDTLGGPHPQKVKDMCGIPTAGAQKLMLSIFQVLANYPNPHDIFVLLLTLYSEVRFVMTWTQNQSYSMEFLPNLDV